jgi:hypothetical protein
MDCECGRTDLKPGQITMHNRSKQHKAWESEGTPIAEALDLEYKPILEAATAGESPFHVAKMVRSLFNRRDWPNEEHTGTVRDWLNEHNIPIIDVPRHYDADEQRRFVADALDHIRSEGWGRTWEVKYG